jgi:hypothetical protein
MTLHETTSDARILQSGTGLIHRKTLNYGRHIVTNAFAMSREVTVCADTWRNRTLSKSVVLALWQCFKWAFKGAHGARKAMHAYFTNHGNVGRSGSISWSA